MGKVAVVYWSGTGNTEAMANYIIEGAKAAGGDVTIFNASQFSSKIVKEYDAIAFGCPSMGSEVLEESEFEPMFSEVKPELKGKKLALFGSYGWGDGEWMRNWENDCNNAGCNIVSDPIIVNGTPDHEAGKMCRVLGEMLAKS